MMNISTALGFFIALAVFALAAGTAFHDARVIFDYHAALMVIGGTVAVTMICFPLNQIMSLLKVFFRRIFGKNKTNYLKIVDEIVMLSSAQKKGKRPFEQAINNISYAFLKDAAKVLYWIKADISPDELRKMLEIRAKTHYREYMAEAKIFRTISKFPPAFGLMGTTLGLIGLFQALGFGDEAKGQIGPAMAVALVATLYGLVFANFIFIPIAENLTKQTQEDEKARAMVIEGIMLIQSDKPTKFVEEHVKSFLLPSQRGDGGPEGPDQNQEMRKAS